MLVAPGVVGCSTSCTDVLVLDEMPFETKLPDGLDPAAVDLEVCFDATCDTTRLVSREGKLVCVDVDGETPLFQTRCSFDPSTRSLAFATNTLYGGREGTDRLVLTAIASGQRTEILRGTVTYRESSTPTSGACGASPWAGTFTRD